MTAAIALAGAASTPFLADIGNTGGAGTLIVLILIVAAIGIFFALIGSLRRLRQHVDDGSFAAKVEAEQQKPPADPSDPRH